MTVARSPGARFLGNATPLLAAQLAVNGLLLVNIVLLARILGVESYGLLAIGMAMYGLTAFLSDAGLGMWGLRVIDDDPDRWATVGRLTAARCITVSLALVLACCAVLLLPLPEGATVPSLVMVVTMVPAGFAVDWALIGLERTGRAAAARLVVGVGVLALSPALAVEAGPTGAAVGYVAAATLGCGVSWILLVRTIGRPRWTSPSGIVATLRHSLPMGVSAVLRQIYWQTDSLLVAIFLGPVAAGLYAAPMRLLASVVGLGWVLGTSLLPVYRALDTTEPEGVSQLATATTRLLLLACLPAAGVVIGGATTIVSTVLGPDFANSAPVLAIGSLTVCAWVCSVPTAYALLARHRDGSFLAAAAAGTCISVTAISITAASLGLTAVAASMLAAQLATDMIILRSAWRLGVRLHGVISVAVVGAAAGIAVGLVALAQPFGLIGVIACGVAAEVPASLLLVRRLDR